MISIEHAENTKKHSEFGDIITDQMKTGRKKASMIKS
jgi:hypothetical protein